MQIERCPLAIKIDRSVHTIQVRANYTVDELFRYILNTFEEAWRYVINFDFQMMYKDRDLMLTPNVELRKILPLGTRSTIEIVATPQ